MAQLHQLTVAEASVRIAAGELSPVSLVKSLLQRIDFMEPSLKAWTTIDKPAVLSAAEELATELKARGPRSPLHGIPVGIKDIYYTAGLRTTAGSTIYAEFVPTYDATSVARLKEAGAITLGKTVTNEFASGDPPLTHNPWNAAHTPGGSSTGSAVAVAARMCPAAMGSQTGGSLIRPAAYNGIVGLKPTFGRISCYGVFPVAWSFDTVGPMVRCVEDAALMLQALAGYDPKDPGTAAEPVPDYRRALDQMDRPPRIGLIKDYFFSHAEPEVQQHTEEAVQRLAQGGAQVEEVSLPPSFATAHDIQWTIQSAECAAYHEELFRQRSDEYTATLRRRIEVGMLVPALHYLQAQRVRRNYRREMETLAQEWDILLTPTLNAPAPRDLTTVGPNAFQSPWTSCGLPTITIPSGLSQSGLPLGLQLAAPPFAEGGLLAAAQWCEQVLDVHLQPPEVA